MHGSMKTITTGKPRSALTNGSRLFAQRIDMRSPRGKRFRDLIDAYSHDAGPSLSEAQRAMVRDLAMLQVISEDMQQSYMESGVMSTEEQTQYSRITNNIRKNMKALGLTTASKKTSADDGDETPLEYMKRKSKPKREHLTHDDEED